MGSLPLTHHLGHRQQNVTPQEYKHWLFQGTWCLSPYCCHFNECQLVFAKMLLPLEQKQTARQMFLMRKTLAREAGMIQLVLGKINVLYAYIIQGVCVCVCVNWLHALAATGWLFCHGHHVSVTLSKKNKKFCIIRCSERQVRSSSLGCCSPAGSPLCCAALILRGSFQCMEPDGEQRTQQGLGTAMYCSARCSAMHTHSAPFLLCLRQSLNLLLYLAASLAHTCVIYLRPSSLHRLLSAFVIVPIFLLTQKADCNSVSYVLYLHYSALYHTKKH